MLGHVCITERSSKRMVMVGCMCFLESMMSQVSFMDKTTISCCICLNVTAAWLQCKGYMLHFVCMAGLCHHMLNLTLTHLVSRFSDAMLPGA